LWHTVQSGPAGLDERFDAGRFGVWLEVLVESGASLAARKVAEMDVDLVIAGLAQHTRVFDRAASTPYTTMDGVEVTLIRAGGDELSCDVGGYLLEARRTESWDAIVAVLMSLEAEHPARFHEVMRGCPAQSNSRPEIDGLDDLLTDRDQTMFDLAFDRERRREKQGYVTPAQAQAFLQMARQLPLGPGDAMPPSNPVARAYFRAMDPGAESDVAGADTGAPQGSDSTRASDDQRETVAAVVEVLRGAGIVPQQPRALLESSPAHAAPVARMHAHMQFVFDRDPVAYSTRSGELAYLANTIMAGCSIQARPFTAQEASDAAAATCNLGLENWPAHWLGTDARCDPSAGEAAIGLPDDFLLRHDLVSVFQVGWKILHRDVNMYVAEHLAELLPHLGGADRETRRELDTLRVELANHCHAGTPWRVRDALDVIAIFDMVAWVSLLALVDECPVIHAGIRPSRGQRTLAVGGSDFEFISENGQIDAVRDFMKSLPDMLSPGY
jgi:hypothetical protein